MKDNSLTEKIEEHKKNREALEHLIKHAEVEVLLDSILISGGSNISVYPANCPGKGRKSDILLDPEGENACMFQGKSCRYFNGSMFRLTDYTKKIMCKVM